MKIHLVSSEAGAIDPVVAEGLTCPAYVLPACDRGRYLYERVSDSEVWPAVNGDEGITPNSEKVNCPNCKRLVDHAGGCQLS